jgi:hypothetical protein
VNTQTVNKNLLTTLVKALTFFSMIGTMSSALSADQVIFTGKPTVKIEMMDGNSKEYRLTHSQTDKLKVVVTQVGEKFYWTSRQNHELTPNKSGFYITYTAKNGSGYIRTMSPQARAIFSQMSETEKQGQYIYFEHLIHQMGSITYFGQ